MKEPTKSSMGKGLYVVFFLLLFLGIGFQPLIAAETAEWRVDCVLLATSGEVKNLQWFCDLVKERSGGRLKLTVYPGLSLGVAVTETYHALKNGTIEMAMAFPEFMVGHAPALSLEGRDGIWPDRDRRWLINKVLFPYRQKIFNEDWGIHSLGSFPLYAVNTGFYTKFPVKTWNDLKGKKVRASSEHYLLTFRSLGAAPLFMPLGEAYMALKTGVIDGVETSPRSGVERSLFEVAKHYTIVWPSGTSGSWSAEFAVSKKHWDKLPADLQAIVQECANDAIVKGFQEAFHPDVEKPYLDKLKAAGVNITFLPLQEREKTAKAAREILRKYMEGSKDARNQEIYKIIKPFLPPV